MTEQKTNSTDWRVGDRILLDTTKDLKKLLIFETIHDCGIVTDAEGSLVSILYKHNNPFIFKGTETEKVHINIDHLLRTKDAEIAALKEDNSRLKLSIDLFTPVLNKLTSQGEDSDAEIAQLKLQLSESHKVIERLNKEVQNDD